LTLGSPIKRISVYGTSVSGKAADEFNKIFASLFPGPNQPLANANYAYDAVISQALAVVKANSINGTDINSALTEVTNPPGTACATYKECVDLIKAGTKANYEGASGDLNYNKYHNVFGPYGAFQETLAGQQQQVQVMTADQLAAATP
jgi:branched-chain amino acid transport system substrate-binding protein